MDFITIIFIIISLICIISLILIFVKIRNMSEIIDSNKNIIYNQILKENELNIPSSITLDKLTVKDLEVENNLTTSNINSNNDSISINSNINLNSDQIQVNPKMNIKALYNYADDTTKDEFKNKKIQLIYVDDTDDSKMDINLHLDEVAYYVGNTYKEKHSREKQKISNQTKLKEPETKQYNFVSIKNDKYFMYDKDNNIIGCIAPNEDKLTIINNDEPKSSIEYEDEYNIYDKYKNPIKIKKEVKQLNLNNNDIIEISKELKKHLDFGNQHRKYNKDLLNSNFYPIQLLDKIKNYKFKIEGEEYNPPAAASRNIIENFDNVLNYNNVPNFDIYYYY